MSKASEMKALSTTLSALCAYKKLYALDRKEQEKFDEAMHKVYNSLIILINN
jgi:hypothetical protein